MGEQAPIRMEKLKGITVSDVVTEQDKKNTRDVATAIVVWLILFISITLFLCAIDNENRRNKWAKERYIAVKHSEKNGYIIYRVYGRPTRYENGKYEIRIRENGKFKEITLFFPTVIPCTNFERAIKKYNERWKKDGK